MHTAQFWSAKSLSMLMTVIYGSNRYVPFTYALLLPHNSDK